MILIKFWVGVALLVAVIFKDRPADISARFTSGIVIDSVECPARFNVFEPYCTNADATPPEVLLIETVRLVIIPVDDPEKTFPL
jgi:hypothetical protein